MTLGRASSGAIKIKTDGSLRAVECGCCSNPRICTCNGPHPALKIILANWSNVNIAFNWPGFMGSPAKSGNFNLSNGYQLLAGGQQIPLNPPIPNRAEYNYNAGSGFVFGSVNANTNDICFSMSDADFGGVITLACNGAESVTINGEGYSANYVNFLPQGVPSVSLFFS